MKSYTYYTSSAFMVTPSLDRHVMNSLSETVPSRFVSDMRRVLMIEEPALVKEFLTRMKR